MSRYVKDLKAAFSLAFATGSVTQPTVGLNDLLTSLNVIHICILNADGTIDSMFPGLSDAPDEFALSLDRFKSLKALADDEKVVRFVVGLPLDMHGGEGMAARGARALAQQVADATGREVELWDERLTTVQAQRELRASEVRGKKARGRIDEAAACVILQSWLDARQGRRGR